MNVVMKQGSPQYKYLTFIAMSYLTLKLATILLIYKVIIVGPITFSASTLIMPFWFFIGTIITETYGYSVARALIWCSIACQLIFACICCSIIQTPSPEWVNQSAYDLVLGRSFRVTVASSLAILFGAFINAYAISKYKILTKGKRFWLRSLKASSIGELVFTIVAYVSEFYGIVAVSKLIELIIISFSVKLILSPILILPVIITTKILKEKEGIDIFDTNTNFNPFRISIVNEEIKANAIESNIYLFKSRDKQKQITGN